MYRRTGQVVSRVEAHALRKFSKHLESFLEVLDVVPVNIVVGSNGLTKLGADDHARAFSGRASSEKHDSPASILK